MTEEEWYAMEEAASWREAMEKEAMKEEAMWREAMEEEAMGEEEEEEEGSGEDDRMSVVTDEVARIRAERVRIVGNDCCHGSDPACVAGCIFAEAVRNIISNVEPEPERAGEREFARLMEDTFRRLDTETRIDDSAEEAWATAYTDIKRLGRWLREGSPPRPIAELVEDIIESLFETRFHLDHDPHEVRAGGAVAESRFVARVFADEILAPWRAGTDATRNTFARLQKIDRAGEQGEDRKAMLWSSVMVRRNWVQRYFADRDVRGTINDLIVYLFRLYGMLADEEGEASERAGERETALREALEEIAAFGCGWDRSNVNPCTKRYASRKEWCAPCIARRALAAAPRSKPHWTTNPRAGERR